MQHHIGKFVRDVATHLGLFGNFLGLNRLGDYVLQSFCPIAALNKLHAVLYESLLFIGQDHVTLALPLQHDFVEKDVGAAGSGGIAKASIQFA